MGWMGQFPFSGNKFCTYTIRKTEITECSSSQRCVLCFFSCYHEFIISLGGADPLVQTFPHNFFSQILDSRVSNFEDVFLNGP